MQKIQKSVLVLACFLGISFFGISFFPGSTLSVNTAEAAVNCSNPPWKSNPSSFFRQPWYSQVLQYYEFRYNCRNYWVNKQKYKNNQTKLKEEQEKEKQTGKKTLEVSTTSGSVTDVPSSTDKKKTLRVINKNSSKTYYAPDNSDEEWNLFLKAADRNSDLEIQEKVLCGGITTRCDTSCYYQARQAYTVRVPYDCNCGKSGCQTCHRNETRYRWVTKTDRCNANCGKNKYIPCGCKYSGGNNNSNAVCNREKSQTCNTNCYYTARVPYTVRVPYSCNCGKSGCSTCHRNETRYRNETRTDRCNGRCATSEGTYPCGCTTKTYSVWKKYEEVQGALD